MQIGLEMGMLWRVVKCTETAGVGGQVKIGPILGGGQRCESLLECGVVLVW